MLSLVDSVGDFSQVGVECFVLILSCRLSKARDERISFLLELGVRFEVGQRRVFHHIDKVLDFLD